MDVWLEKKAGELVTFRTGKLDSNAAEDDGKYPFFTCAQQTYRINKNAFDTECVLLAGNNAAGVFSLKYFSGKFNAYQRTYIIEPKDRSELSAKYLYYYLRPLLKAFEQQATGVTTKFLTLKILKSFIVKFPQIQQQRKIAAILTTYDELIEVNKRRIALLEKMAEELYREWFVRMRFPGHQNTRFVKGVPEGWKTIRFADICKFIKGRTASDLANYPSENFLPYVNTSLLRGQNPEFAKRENNSVLCEEGDVLMLMDGSNSGLVFRAKAGIVASTFALIAMNKEYHHFIYEFLQASRESIISNNTGSAVPHANKEFINRLVIFFPENDQLIMGFNKKYEDIFNQRVNLLGQNENLTQTRDLLLPRLISGKLSVEDLDIQFPPGMQETTQEEAPEPEVVNA